VSERASKIVRRTVNDPRARQLSLLLALLVLALMTLGEIRLRERLLFSNHVELQFVADSVAGIREGRPAFKAWQHRVLAPALISVVAAVAGDQARALEIFSGIMVAGANLLFFAMVRRRAGTLVQAVLVVAALGFCRLLLTYKLEYPWDGVDVLLFLLFGYWVSRDGPLLSLTPLLVVGAFNHETVLYIPLWYLLAALEPARRSPATRRNLTVAVLASLLIGGLVIVLRARLYVGPPLLRDQPLDVAAPVIGNVLHARHNLWQLVVEDWRHGRALLNGGMLLSIVLLAVLGARRLGVTAVVWSVAVVVTIFCFGYMSETRLYLPLMAFWFAYAWPANPTVSTVVTPAAGGGGDAFA
jgi:hypothetical protein